MTLPGNEFGRLQDALLDGYPKKSDLEQMVRIELGESLDAITSGSNQRERIFELIAWAQARGQLDELIDAAIRSNPENPMLAEFAKEKLSEETTQGRSVVRDLLAWPRGPIVKAAIFGLITGFVLGIGISTLFITWSHGPDNASASRRYVRIFDVDTNRPRILEGSHYKLRPNAMYRLEVENIEPLTSIVWQLVPDNFGQIEDRGTEAQFFTPPDPDGTSGIIKVCTLDESNQCVSLGIPEIHVVIASR